MLYLMLAIASSALISILMRVSEKYRKNHLSMLAINYLACSVLAWLNTGSVSLSQSPDGSPWPMSMLLSAAGLGTVSGVLFLVSFMLLQWNISKNGVVLSSMFMKLGVLVPTAMSILFFGESPSAVQLLGACMAVGAICLIQGGGKGEILSMSGLIVLLLIGGITDGMAKIYEEIGAAELKYHYLMFVFLVAMVLCTALCVVKKQKLCAADALFGLLIGVPNYFSSQFLLESLAEVSAVVAYPTFSVGTIVLVTVAGVLLFKEKLSRRKLITLGGILVALALLNL